VSDAARNVATLLVLASVCLWMPLLLRTIPVRADRERVLRRAAARLHGPAALCLCAAFVAPEGHTAALLALPWLLATALLAAAGAVRGLRSLRDLAALTEAAALCYPCVGAAWALCSRAGIQPLGFPPAIVLLTAAHFHHAGFTLPLAAAALLRLVPGPAARTAAGVAIAGMPVVAAGITATQLGAPPWLEATAATATAAAAWLTATLLLGRTLVPGTSRAQRAGAGLAGGALLASMTLAIAYALRTPLEFEALADLDAMVFAHGALNGVLFAAGALLLRAAPRA
jgi:hypothetical protein